MGYAMFAAKKIMLTNSIFNIQSQLNEIQYQRDDLFDAISGVSDGEIDSMDVAACRNAGLMVSYAGELEGSVVGDKFSGEYQHGLANAKKESYEKYGASWGANITGAGVGAAIGTAILPGIGTLIGGIIGGFVGNKLSSKTKARKEYVEQYKQQAEETAKEEKVREIQRRLEKLDNQLEKQQKRLETKLTAQQADLEQTEKAETQGIKNATPKYAGLGQQ